MQTRLRGFGTHVQFVEEWHQAGDEGDGHRIVIQRDLTDYNDLDHQREFLYRLFEGRIVLLCEPEETFDQDHRAFVLGDVPEFGQHGLEAPVPG